jgi:hypothetical protein
VQAAELMAELGSQLREVLPPGSIEAMELAERLDPQKLLDINVPSLLSLLSWSAGLVVTLGAPARDAAAAAGREVVQAQLVTDGPGVAATRALRLLSIQLKLLRLDAGKKGEIVLGWSMMIALFGHKQSPMLCYFYPLP